MKRALVFGFAALLFGVAGLAQISGEFSGKLALTPDVALKEVVLALKYSVAGFEITGTSKFNETGWVSQEFGLTGAFGPVSVEGSMSFLPAGEKVLKDITYELTDITNVVIPGVTTPWTFTVHGDEKWAVAGPAYLSSSLDLAMDFAGVSLGLAITHEANKVVTFDEICDGLTWYEVGYSYTLQTTSDSATVTVEITDRDWHLSGPCCYDQYFVAGLPEMLLAKVEISEYQLEDGEVKAVRTTTLEGPFDVFDYDASPLTIELSNGAKDYIKLYYLEVLCGEEGWSLSYPPVFAVKGTYTPSAGEIVVWLDPEDLSIKFLLPSYMTYTFTAEVEPVSVEVVFDSVTGFKEATITLSDLSICCDIAYNAELHFTNCDGFEYLKFSVDLFELCCNVSFGVDVKFTVDAKSVTPKFSWAGITGCVTVYGDLQLKPEPEVGIDGWELYGYKISCELAERYSLEFLHAFNVSAVEETVGDIFKGDEFEYVKLGAYGPACCGGDWTLAAAIYFDNGGGLFGISRYTVDASLPIMDALTIGFSFESPDTIYVSWTFTF